MHRQLTSELHKLLPLHAIEQSQALQVCLHERRNPEHNNTRWKLAVH
jgi:hypothetical protein